MRIAVAMSGGVDSLVAAHLLQRDGHDVFGIHFLTGFESASPDDSSIVRKTTVAARISGIRRMTDALQIPLEVVDLGAAFFSTVATYLIDTYGSGRTPNPCMVCNPSIKLGSLWQSALKHGAEALATGHYAVIGQDADGRPALFKGADRDKDQSYFLARVTGEQLSRAMFPLGRWQKAEVKALAIKAGLRPTITIESQDICFLQGDTIAAFMARHGGALIRPGPIRDVSGRVVGSHQGLYHFTVGQRRGINIPAAAPYYVVRLDVAENCLIVGGKPDLTATACRVAAINWIAPPPEAPMAATTKVRYRSRQVPAMVIPTGPDTAEVRFAAPVEAVTPGQGAVFYDGDRVLGGGWIAADAAF
ncbi:MAG: tRNA 2-thiouridine(34) synthase MnmA [Pseudomonadota bacterium]